MAETSASLSASAAFRWPEHGLESVPACPVCDSTSRELAHGNLRDRVFSCAPGEWNLYRCTSCGSGYLDPRPNAASIGLAYSRYCTHSSAASVERPPRSAWRRHRLAQRNAYLNETYGYQLGLTTKLRPWRLSTDRRQRWDKHCGYLKFPGPGARLLDIGCGNGRFLLQMRALGWDVAGVEPDPKSAAEAVAAGLKVRQGLLEPGTQPGNYFDAVTLNHVIEHLHDPVKTLSLSRQALKPGGVIYLATPNFAAGGHRLFGADWFPLDPPRHLVLFTPQSLRRALERAGFEPEPSIRPRFTALEMFSRSAHLQRGSDPMREEPTLPFTVKLKIARLAREADRATRADINLTEELVQLASRP